MLAPVPPLKPFNSKQCGRTEKNPGRGLFSGAEGLGLLNHTDCAVMRAESSTCHTELPSILSSDDLKAVLT